MKRYFAESYWSGIYMLTTIFSSLIVLGILIFIFVIFEDNVSSSSGQQPAEARAIPTYLAIFIFAEVYQCILSFDALRKKNIIHIIGFSIFNIAMLAYASIQYGEIKNAVKRLSAENLYSMDDWTVMRGFAIAVPCVIATSWVATSLMTWRLYQEFGWSIYKHIGADLRLKRKYLVYLIFDSLLKFDFFFFLGFTLQFVVIVLNVKDVEFALTIAMIPATIIFLYLVRFCARREQRAGMILLIAFGFCPGLAYFLFKLVRMYTASQAAKYEATRKTMTAFAVLTITLLGASVVNAIMCTLNFGQGLGEVLGYKTSVNHGYSVYDDDEKIPMVPMVNFSAHEASTSHLQLQQRMSLD